jgi:hypothetical protein
LGFTEGNEGNEEQADYGEKSRRFPFTCRVNRPPGDNFNQPADSASFVSFAILCELRFAG